MKRLNILSVAVMAATSQLVFAEEFSPVEEVVVTGVRTDSPLQLSTNPKNPRQPLPAHDGADYLKTIPGFSVIRKGGTDGDPVLRGMAGSRLSMLMDGEMILGGCNARMDPPTAYVFPETFDNIKVIKGPQSVQYGPGNSAGVVLFERNNSPVEEAGWKLHSSALTGSFGRHDEVIDLQYQSPQWEMRGSASQATADNYQDGDGTEVNSAYQRWNAQLSLAWRPDINTRLELSTAFSDGEAAYADRNVDGSKFSRENLNIKFSREFPDRVLSKVEAQTYYNYVDHVMDNYSLRSPSGMMPNPSAMNPDRTTSGGKLVFTLAPMGNLEVDTGVDTQRNSHTSRNTMNENLIPFESLARIPDASFSQVGVFAELRWDINADWQLYTGYRADLWSFEDERQSIALSMMSTTPNPLAGMERDETLHSSFLRLEHTIGDSGLTWYTGIGRSERFPDYWEITKETANSLAATDTLSPETNTQLDTGLLLKRDNLEASVSFFFSDVQDYLMIQSGYMKPAILMTGMGMSGMSTMDMSAMGATPMRATTIVRNIDTRSWGVEVDSQYRFNEHWRMEMTLSSVRGANDTDRTTLAQLPPLEGRIGLYYDNNSWSTGLLWRALARQDRVDIGKGNIVGQDFSPTAAANILSVNAGWRATDQVLVTAGIDNLLDETYAEHISRSGASIPGFDQIARINEPGRVLWMKAQYSF